MDIEFQWTQEMSVYNNVLDEQHQQLFTKINELLEAIINEDTQDVVGDMVNFFERYMMEHLEYEENFLKDIGYPQTQNHHEQHAVFVDKYNELRERLNDEDIDKNQLAFKIENFMGSWLTGHILIEDQKYAKYIEKMNSN